MGEAKFPSLPLRDLALVCVRKRCPYSLSGLPSAALTLTSFAELVLCISTYTSPSFMDVVSPGGCRRVQREYRSRLDSLGNSLSFDYARYYQHAFAYCGASYICYTDLSSELLIKRVHPAKSALQGLTVNYISARSDYATMVS